MEVDVLSPHRLEDVERLDRARRSASAATRCRSLKPSRGTSAGRRCVAQVDFGGSGPQRQTLRRQNWSPSSTRVGRRRLSPLGSQSRSQSNPHLPQAYVFFPPLQRSFFALQASGVRPRRPHRPQRVPKSSTGLCGRPHNSNGAPFGEVRRCAATRASLKVTTDVRGLSAGSAGQRRAARAGQRRAAPPPGGAGEVTSDQPLATLAPYSAALPLAPEVKKGAPATHSWIF